MWWSVLSFTEYTCAYCGPGSSVAIATELRAGRSGDRIPVGRDFPPIQTGPGAHPASCAMGTGSFPGVKYSWGVLLTTHPLLVPRSWKSRAIPLPTLWATTGPVTGTIYTSMFIFFSYLFGFRLFHCSSLFQIAWFLASFPKKLGKATISFVMFVPPNFPHETTWLPSDRFTGDWYWEMLDCRHVQIWPNGNKNKRRFTWRRACICDCFGY